MTIRFKKNGINTALKKGKIPLGMQVYTGNPSIIEILAYTGFDFYMLDMEHSRVNPETMEHCIRAADAAGITTIVRVTENNPSLIRHAIEAGAQGVIVPHIDNVRDVRRAIEAVRYPPEGKCGTCGSIRSNFWGALRNHDYLEYSNKNVMLIPLLEEKTGIDNAEEILAQLTPGLDAVGIGRGDLMLSLRTKSEDNKNEPHPKRGLQHPYIREAYDKVLSIANRMGIPLIDNIFSPEDAKTQVNMGIKILIYFIDQQLFRQLCEEKVREVKKLGLRPVK
jgi:2-keto-3-deoxy-L-rhamnonate aldolase RhmA